MSVARIAVSALPGKGRALVARAPLAAGELLEAAPAIDLASRDTDAIAATVLDDYYFAHPLDPERGLLVLGLATLANHSDDPNAQTAARHAEGLGWMVELHSLRPIAPGEEITRRYACPL